MRHLGMVHDKVVAYWPEEMQETLRKSPSAIITTSLTSTTTTTKSATTTTSRSEAS